ncbi:MAG: hypothetical protein AB7Q23_15085 [Hyphomonadaceae bacterium]
MGLVILLLTQLAATAVGFVFLWRRTEALKGEVAELRRALEAAEARQAAPQRRARRADGAVAPIAVSVEEVIETAPSGPLARAAQLWGRADSPEFQLTAPTLSAETGRGLALAVMATAPALGFFFGAPVSSMVAAGLAIATAMIVISLRPMWTAAAWAAVITAAAWAMLGTVLGAAQLEPVSYSMLAAVAATAGLVHAHLRRAAPGAVMALAMCAAVLALGSQIGVASPAGAGFGLIVAAAAIVGALSLRLEAVHFAAFGAALLGLFVLSGQHEAAIWFTPAVTWAGALFLAIAAVRVPQLGARGVALAGTGILAPLAALIALYTAQHGLADRYAAAAAFAVLAATFSAVIAAAALRNARGVQALKATLWMLSLGAFVAASCAIMLALPAPIAAPAFMVLATGLCALNARIPDAVWRTFACLAVVLGLVQAWVSGAMLLGESADWSAWQLAAFGVAAPAVVTGFAASLALRQDRAFTSGVLEATTILLAVAAANLIVRLSFSSGAMLLQPVGFVELGVHSVVWLIAALFVASRARRGVGPVRMAAALLLCAIALAANAIGAVLWVTNYWMEHVPAVVEPWSRQTLGFLLPAVMYGAHWVFWRARGSEARTHIAMGAGALMMAAFLTAEAMQAEGWPDWAGALVGALSFALAIGINFAPGVTNADARRR